MWGPVAENSVRHSLDKSILPVHLCTTDGCFRRNYGHAPLTDGDTF